MINGDEQNNLTSSLSGFLSSSLRAPSSTFNQDPTLAVEAKTEVVIETSRFRSKRKKKVKGQTNVVSLDKVETPQVVDSIQTLRVSSPIQPNGQPAELSSRLDSHSNSSEDLPLIYDSIDLRKKESQRSNVDFESPDYEANLIGVQSSESPSAVVTSDSLTPITNKSIGALFLVSAVRASLLSEDTAEENPSQAPRLEDLDYASNPLISNRPEEIFSGDSDFSLKKDDLKQALLSVMERKDELEDRVKSMKKRLDEEIKHVADVKQELSDLKQINKEKHEKLEAKNAIQTRENELLKHQLKKYVGAVQKLRDGSHAYETLAKLDQTEQNRYIDYHYEASEYEKKLIQVAEMHGELLEFNENLQKSLQSKDATISRLTDELVSLRGPLPDDEDRLTEDTASVCSSYTEAGSSGSARPLVNIWIPTVYLTGSGSKKHHVYQVT